MPNHSAQRRLNANRKKTQQQQREHHRWLIKAPERVERMCADIETFNRYQRILSPGQACPFIGFHPHCFSHWYAGPGDTLPQLVKKHWNLTFYCAAPKSLFWLNEHIVYLGIWYYTRLPLMFRRVHPPLLDVLIRIILDYLCQAEQFRIQVKE